MGKTTTQANDGVLIFVKNESSGSYPVDVLMRRDYSHENAASFVWIGHINRTTNIDLGGYSFSCTQGWRTIIPAAAASWPARKPVFNFSNGTMLLGGASTPIVNLNKYDITHVLVPTTYIVNVYIEYDEEYKILYQDDVFVLYERIK